MILEFSIFVSLLEVYQFWIGDYYAVPIGQGSQYSLPSLGGSRDLGPDQGEIYDQEGQ